MRLKPLIIGIIWLISTSAFAQTSSSRFTRVELPVHVPSISINALTKDHNGLLWISTNDGLVRFGSSNDVFIYNTSNTKALKSNLIEAVFEDSKDKLWIGTRYGGLTCLDQNTGKWKTFQNNFEDQNSISNNEVLCLFEDSKQRLWIGTESGLNLYNPATEKFIRFEHNSTDPESLSNRAVLSIFEDSYGFLWVSTWGGALNIFQENDEDIASSTFKKIWIENKKKQTESIWSIFQDKENNYWFGSHFSGLFFTELTQKQISSLTSNQYLPIVRNFVYDPLDNSSISSDIQLSDIEQDIQGNLWISSANGLSKISHEKLQELYIDGQSIINFERFKTDPYNNVTIPSEHIQCLYSDNSGLIWIGSDKGLASLNGNVSKLNFFEIKDKNNEVQTVSDIYFNEDERLLVGISESDYGSPIGNINIYDFKEKKISPINEVYSFIGEIPDFKTFFPLSRNEVLIVRGSGIDHINFKEESSTELSIPPVVSNSLANHLLRRIFKDSKNRLWLSFDTHLLMLESDRKSAVNFSDGKYKDFLSDLSVTSVVEDYNNHFWVSSYNGLNKIVETDTGYSCIKFLHDTEDSSSIPSNRLLSMIIKDSTLYFGTTSGLVSYNIASEDFKRIRMEKGKETIYRVLDGGEDIVWASSKNQIIYYNHVTKNYNIFRDKNLSIYNGAVFSDKEKYLWAGGQRGFVRLDFSEIYEDITYPVALTPEVMTYNSEGSQLITINRNKTLTFSPDISRFEISFCSTNLINMEYNQFAYRMVGFEEEWTYTNITKPIAYTNLDAGNYRFEIKTADDMGQWSEAPSYINFELEAAFYETNWFKLMSLIFLASVIYCLFKLYNYRVVKANAILKQEITKRIETEEELKVVNAQLKETSLEMERFAFVASHDLKEPLRTIGAFSSLLKRKYEDKIDDKGKQYLGHITQGVSRMYSLIESLLNYSSNKEANLEKEHLHLDEVVEEVKHDLSEIITNNNALVETENLPTIMADKTQLLMLLSNLIKNGIKFNKSKIPVVKISESHYKDGMQTLVISDNGIGISQEKFEEIFVIFKRLHGKSSYEGSGIGLALCKKIMERHEGEIWLESEVDKGTTFYLSFPIKEPTVIKALELTV